MVKPPEQIIRKLPSPSRSRSLQVLVLARHLQSLHVTPKNFNGDAMQPENRGISPWEVRRFPAFWKQRMKFLRGFPAVSFFRGVYSYNKISKTSILEKKKGDLKRRFNFPKTPPHCHLEKHYRSIKLSE